MSAYPIQLSLVVALLSTALIVVPGIALAVFLSGRRGASRVVVDALVLLPLVLPPSVTGYALIVVFGSQGVVGSALSQLGIRLIFTPAAAVIAAAVVALPVLVKTAEPALAAVPNELTDVGKTLGLGPVALFWRVVLPVAWPGILAALVLAFARALGEFGATLLFAGNIPGSTNTMPIELYSAFQRGDERTAFAYVAILTALSLAVVMAAAVLTRRR